MAIMHLKKWSVHYFKIEELDDPKSKYVVVLLERPTSFLGAFINSRLAAFLERPKLAACSMMLAKDKHDFLTHDSYFSVDNENIIEYDLARVSAATLVGNIHPDACEQIKECVRRCPILRPGMMREILED